MKIRYMIASVFALIACFFVLASCEVIKTTSTIPTESDFVFASIEAEFDSEEHTTTLEGNVPAGYRVEYANNTQTEIGEYTAYAYIIDTTTQETVLTLTASIVITFPELNARFAKHFFLYDGEEHEVELIGELPEGFRVRYNNNVMTEVGKYYMSADIVDAMGKVYKTYKCVGEIDKAQNAEFEELTDELFVELLEGDQMSINFFFNDATSYGFEHYDAELPFYTPRGEDYEEGIQEIRDLIAELEAFADEDLNKDERYTKAILVDYLNQIIDTTENMTYMTNSYLGSYLGYQSNLPLELAEYKLRNEQDVIDFITYCEQGYDAFVSYFEFTQAQSEKGYGMPDYVIDNVKNQCDEFVAMGEDNFLIEIFNDKLDAVEFECELDTVENYKTRLYDAVVGPLTDGYKYVADHIEELKGQSTIYGGLALYGEEGLTYYKMLLNDALGFKNVDVEGLFDYVVEHFSSADNSLNRIVSQYQALDPSNSQAFYTAVVEGTILYADLDYDGVVAFFQEAAKAVVPELEEMPIITIKSVPEALKDNFSPACYFISPIDETRYESIYLNPKYEDDYNYCFITLAHEGYPGHLYQNVYTKSLDINNIRRVLTCGGYKEGWATYVENKAYYMSDVYQANKGLTLAAQYNQQSSVWELAISCIFDIAIHGLGYGPAEFIDLFNELTGYGYSFERISGSFEQISEIPTNMSEYCVSYLILQDCHDYLKRYLGSDFDEVDFNRVLLDQGGAPLWIVVGEVRDYLQDQLILKYGVDYLETTRGQRIMSDFDVMFAFMG